MIDRAARDGEPRGNRGYFLLIFPFFFPLETKKGALELSGVISTILTKLL